MSLVCCERVTDGYVSWVGKPDGTHMYEDGLELWAECPLRAAWLACRAYLAGHTYRTPSTHRTALDAEIGVDDE